MSRHNRDRRKNPPGQRKDRGQERTYCFTEPPPRPFETDLSKIRICPGPVPTPPPSPPLPGADDSGTTEHESGSRFNAIRDSLRSRILFSDKVFQAISERAGGFSQRLQAAGPLDEYLIWEIARCSVQSELCEDQLLVNRGLAAERAMGPRWVVDKREQADRLGAKLSSSPYRTARALERTKYGALYLIEKLTGLGQVVEKHSCLDKQQISFLFDLLGVDEILRDGSKKVPAPDDAARLSDVIAAEISRHRESISRSLDALDQNERTAVQYGIVRKYDEETRRLRSDQSRAERRRQWAWDAFWLIRQGVNPATIIDPETRKPIAPGPRLAAAPEPTRAAPPPPPPPPPVAEETPAPPPPAELPSFAAKLPEEFQESLMILAETIGQARADAQAAMPPAAAEPPPLL